MFDTFVDPEKEESNWGRFDCPKALIHCCLLWFRFLLFMGLVTQSNPVSLCTSKSNSPPSFLFSPSHQTLEITSVSSPVTVKCCSKLMYSLQCLVQHATNISSWVWELKNHLCWTVGPALCLIHFVDWEGRVKSIAWHVFPRLFNFVPGT